MKLISLFVLLSIPICFSYGQNQTEKIKDPIGYIKKETIGGKLDFNKVLEAEGEKFYMYDLKLYSQKDFAIFLWGQAVKRLKVNSLKKAVKLWEEIHARKLEEPEKKALTAGFEAEIKE